MSAPPPMRNRGDTIRLGLLFGALYFVQGIAEPTEGLIAQPVRSLLSDWRPDVRFVAGFSALVALPWVFKPLYGLLTDYVPLFGRRRKSYLLVTTATASAGLAYLACVEPDASATTLLFWCLFAPTLGVAFADVVIDALMVERGQPRGLTGTLQSVQWASIYTGTILAGWLGGQLSKHGAQRFGFGICAAALAVSFLICLFALCEEPGRGRADLRTARKSLSDSLRLPAVCSVGAFIFLWNFNPFLTAVLQFHMTKRLGFAEDFYGETISLQAMASVAASVAYGFYCRRVPFRVLVHVSIVLGIASTLAYWMMADVASARWISVVAGFTYMTALLVQLDLAARACPLDSAGTVFALFMAVSNASMLLSTWLGGIWYDQLERQFGTLAGFNVLVGIGALFSAGCWLTVPWVARTLDLRTKTARASSNNSA